MALCLRKWIKRFWRFKQIRVNEVIKYFKSKSIKEANNLIRAASVWLAERIEFKKPEHRKQKNQGENVGLREI